MPSDVRIRRSAVRPLFSAALGLSVAMLLALPSAISQSPTIDRSPEATINGNTATNNRPIADADGRQRSESNELVVGIEGHYRVGRWTALRLRGEWPERATVIETRDGDGVRVDYDQASAMTSGDWGYVVPGTEAAPLILRHEDGPILSTRFPIMGSPSRGPSMIPLKMPWIVAIGDPLGIDRIGENELLGRDPMLAVSSPQEPSALPDSVLGYDGVDMMILGGTSQPLLEGLNQAQQFAISSWITGGGEVFLTLGESSPSLLRAAPWLLDLLPIDESELQTVSLDPSAIESFTSSQTPLEEFAGLRLPRQLGKTLITGRTTRRITTPLAVRYSAGFGQITVIAADLDAPLFADWPERQDLITRLTGSILIPQTEETAGATRAAAYDDLAGQTRVTLDQFGTKRRFSFSILSLILMGLIAAVGPLDYLLINRLLGRPLLGWLSVPLIAVGLSAVLIYQSRPVEATDGQTPDFGLRANRLEFVDIDTIANVGQGCSLSHLYTHPASLNDVDVEATESLTAITGDISRMLTAPFGYPGPAFGGIQIAIEDARLPTYQVDTRVANDGGVHGSVIGMPMAPRSSKSLATRFWFTPSIRAAKTPTRRPGGELLYGELANPLPVDLLEGMLIYRNWVYLLPTRFPSGDSIPTVEDLRQKNFRWQLSRQKALEEHAIENESWDPTMNGSPSRIAEILMFHEAVGGTRYTSLNHRPLSFLDLTDSLVEDRCMLVGRLAQPLTSLTADGPDREGHSPPGESLTLIRVVLPVVVSKRR